MDNVFERKLEEKPIEKPRPLHSSDFPPGIIEQRAIHQGLICFRGLIADRPSDGGTEKQMYFAEDESKLYIFNRVNEAWEVISLA